MPTLAIVLVLVAAVLHAGWNVLLKTSGDTLWTAVRLQAIGTAILRADRDRGLAGERPAGGPGGRRSGSRSSRACSRRSYFVLPVLGLPPGRPVARLPAGARQRAAARGRVGILLLGERLPPLALVGSPACWSASCSSPGRGGRSGRPAGEHRGAIGFALATGASIAAYSAVDRLGVRDDGALDLRLDPRRRVATILLASTVVVGRRLGFLAPAPAPRRRPAAPTGRLGSRPRPRRARRRAVADAPTCSSSSPTRSRRWQPSRRCGNRGSSSPRRGARSGSARPSGGARRRRGSPPRGSWSSARSCSPSRADARVAGRAARGSGAGCSWRPAAARGGPRAGARRSGC